MSGIHLFGIHLETLKQARESKGEDSDDIQLKQIKPIEYCSKSTIYKRQRKFGDQLKEQVQIKGAKIYGKDQVILKQISYNVKNVGFQIAYGSKDDREKEKKLTSIVQAIDQNYMSREGYRALTAVEPDLEREWIVSDQRLKITKYMNQKIEIILIDIPVTPTLDELDFTEINIFDEETSEIKNITNGGHRSAKDILTYIIPALVLKGVLDVDNPIIHLRISGDGRNVGRKIKQVMIIMAILNDEQNIHKPDHHYTTILFPGVESYELLEVMMSPFIQELDDLKNYGLKINDIIWKFELYFSSDWKFLSTCLGFNAPNSNHFCPWCQISKHDQGNNQINWKISKDMEKINEYPGHNKKPLFNMISLDHWIPDELHIMLRIFDRLWSLVLSELKDVDQFDNICRNEIVQEMNRIGVRFQFWKENGSNTWNYTSLMGGDKLKVLKKFNLGRILPPSRTRKIRELWDRFNQIYCNLKLKDYDPQQFQFEAEDWLELFLTPDRVMPNSNRIEKGLYSPSAITPYIHVLVYHMSEFMEIHKRWGMKAFSCAPVEKKNHQQVTLFFRQTLKGGGSKHKSVIKDILEYENRSLFYLFDDVVTSTSKPKKLNIF